MNIKLLELVGHPISIAIMTPNDWTGCYPVVDKLGTITSIEEIDWEA